MFKIKTSLIILVFIIISLVSAVELENTFETCNDRGGVTLCDTYYCCGVEDAVCPDAYGSSCDSDPDCSELGCSASCVSSEGYCNAECDGINGCNITGHTPWLLNDSRGWSQDYLCQGVIENAMVDYNSTHDVVCCGGPPIEKIQVSLSQTEIDGEEKTIAKYTKLVNYKGIPVRMVMIVWG